MNKHKSQRDYKYRINVNKMYVVFTTAYLALVGLFGVLLFLEKDFTLMYLVLTAVVGMGICLAVHVYTQYKALAKSGSLLVMYMMLTTGYLFYDYGPVSFISIILALIPSYSVLVTERGHHLRLQSFHFAYMIGIYLLWVAKHHPDMTYVLHDKNALYITIMTSFLGTLLSFHLNSILDILEKQNQQLTDTHKRLGVFLSDVSHQIKTPLNGIMGIQNLLEMSDADEDRSELFEILRHSSWNMLRDMNNIMELSKIEGDMINLFSEYFSLDEIIKDIEYIYKDNSYSKLHTINYTPNGQTYLGDKGKVKLIVENIIENTFSHNPEAEIIVFMDDSDSFRLHLIDPQKSGSRTVIKKVYNDEDDNIRNSSSLGLYMSDSLAKLLGGEFTFYEEEAGTHYELILPYKALNTYQLQNWKEQPKKEIKNLLLVEDNAVSRKIISSHFTKRDYNITTTENGLEALEYITKNYDDIDVIFMDIQMPIMDGTTATKKIRNWEYQNSNKMKPIIALTANTMFEDKVMCYSSGINYFLGKPFNPQKMELLMKKIEENKIY